MRRGAQCHGISLETSHTRGSRFLSTWPWSSSQTTRNWMVRSGMEITGSTLRYSGFFWNNVDFSSVETNSERERSAIWTWDTGLGGLGLLASRGQHSTAASQPARWRRLERTVVGLLKLRLHREIRHVYFARLHKARSIL